MFFVFIIFAIGSVLKAAMKSTHALNNNRITRVFNASQKNAGEYVSEQ